MATILPRGELPPTGFIRQTELLQIVPFSAATLWRQVKAGKFPPPVQLAKRTTAWKISSVMDWIAAVDSTEPAPAKRQKAQTIAPASQGG